jgi:hypothetical protein
MNSPQVQFAEDMLQKVVLSKCKQTLTDYQAAMTKVKALKSRGKDHAAFVAEWNSEADDLNKQLKEKGFSSLELLFAGMDVDRVCDKILDVLQGKYDRRKRSQSEGYQRQKQAKLEKQVKSASPPSSSNQPLITDAVRVQTRSGPLQSTGHTAAHAPKNFEDLYEAELNLSSTNTVVSPDERAAKGIKTCSTRAEWPSTPADLSKMMSAQNCVVLDTGHIVEEAIADIKRVRGIVDPEVTKHLTGRQAACECMNLLFLDSDMEKEWKNIFRKLHSRSNADSQRSQLTMETLMKVKPKFNTQQPKRKRAGNSTAEGSLDVFQKKLAGYYFVVQFAEMTYDRLMQIIPDGVASPVWSASLSAIIRAFTSGCKVCPEQDTHLDRLLNGLTEEGYLALVSISTEHNGALGVWLNSAEGVRFVRTFAHKNYGLFETEYKAAASKSTDAEWIGSIGGRHSTPEEKRQIVWDCIVTNAMIEKGLTCFEMANLELRPWEMILCSIDTLHFGSRFPNSSIKAGGCSQQHIGPNLNHFRLHHYIVCVHKTDDNHGGFVREAVEEKTYDYRVDRSMAPLSRLFGALPSPSEMFFKE